jgi:hypothetical protein
MDNNEQQERDRIWKMVEECGVYERHFNQLQSFYRGLASTWLLAAFGGIGYVLTKEPTLSAANKQPPLLDLWIAAGWVGVAGAVGLFFLWAVDVLVYHKLLLGVFAVGRKLETENTWLPPLRSSMNAPAGYVITRFYGVGMFMLLAVAGFAFAFGEALGCRHFGSDSFSI